MTLPTLSTRQASAIRETYEASRGQGHATAFSIALGIYRMWFPAVPTVHAADEVNILLATARAALPRTSVPYVFCE